MSGRCKCGLCNMPDDEPDPYEVISEAADQRQDEEPTYCGNPGKVCRHIFDHCDYHVEMGDALFHERQDRELED